MPGNIVDLLVAEGDTVAVGQPILVTEAMKMETEIQAPIAGVVKVVYVKNGVTVRRVGLLGFTGSARPAYSTDTCKVDSTPSLRLHWYGIESRN